MHVSIYGMWFPTAAVQGGVGTFNIHLIQPVNNDCSDIYILIIMAMTMYFQSSAHALSFASIYIFIIITACCNIDKSNEPNTFNCSEHLESVKFLHIIVRSKHTLSIYYF